MRLNVKSFLRLFTAFQKLEAERNELKAELLRRKAAEVDAPQFFPAGHFYSPLPSRTEIAEAFARGGFGPPFADVERGIGQVRRELPCDELDEVSRS